MFSHKSKSSNIWKSSSKAKRRLISRREPCQPAPRYQNFFQSPSVPVSPQAVSEDENEDVSIPSSAREVDRLPRDVQAALRDYTAVASCSSASEAVQPYLKARERENLRNAFSKGQWDDTKSIAWEEGLIHVDFSFAELTAILRSIKETSNGSIPSEYSTRPTNLDSYSEVSRLITHRLRSINFNHISDIVRHIRSRDAEEHLRRGDADIEAFLEDAAAGLLSCSPKAVRFAASTFSHRQRDHPALPSYRRLQLRELGAGYGRRGWNSTAEVLQQRKLDVYDSMKVWRSWHTGGSGDTVSVAWAPSGDTFAAGCTDVTDDHNMQYNRRNNLLLGHISDDTIYELPFHRLPRHRPADGPNSTDEMVEAMDPWLFYTVSSVAFSSGGLLYSASYDKTVKVWDTNASGSLLGTLAHDDQVDIVATSYDCGQAIATGSAVSDGGVRVYTVTDEDPSCWAYDSYSSTKALKHPDRNIHPSCIQWGKHHSVQHLLLAGFSPDSDMEERRMESTGDLCLWDVESGQLRQRLSARNTFDCIWQSNSDKFATGCVADSSANRGTRTYVRLYGPTSGSYLVMFDLECPALDVNEITWSHDERYALASCTDGRTYVWDIRRHDRIMHTLCHGEALNPLAHDRPREATDTGVKFASWGETNDRFYTGSSDGVVKSWNIKRAAEDVLVQDVVHLDAGVMSGSFSPDYSHLLLGDVVGGVNLLRAGLGSEDEDRPGPFRFEPTDHIDRRPTPVQEHVVAARRMLRRYEMRITYDKEVPQAVQGPNYTGPYDRSQEAVHDRAQQVENERIFQQRKQRPLPPKTPAYSPSNIRSYFPSTRPPPPPEERVSTNDWEDDRSDGGDFQETYEFDLGIFR